MRESRDGLHISSFERAVNLSKSLICRPPAPKTSLSCGLRGEDFLEWNERTQVMLARAERIDRMPISALGLEGLKELMLHGDCALVEYRAIGKHIAEYGGTEARDVLIDVLRRNCGSDRIAYIDNYRFNIAREAVLALGFLTLRRTLSRSDENALKQDLEALRKDMSLDEWTRNGIADAWGGAFPNVGRKLVALAKGEIPRG